MKIEFKKIWVVLLVFVMLVFVSCDKKDPDKGYLSNDEVLKIVEKFEHQTSYNKFSYKGTLQYLGLPNEKVPNTIDVVDNDFVDGSSGLDIGPVSTREYSSKSRMFKLYNNDETVNGKPNENYQQLYDPKNTPEFTAESYKFGSIDNTTDKVEFLIISKVENSFVYSLTEKWEEATNFMVETIESLVQNEYYVSLKIEEDIYYLDIQKDENAIVLKILETKPTETFIYSQKYSFRKKIDSVNYFIQIRIISESYYLRLPLHLTYENWTASGNSTKKSIENMLLTVGKTLDEVYYYTDAQGNFIIKTFGANKALIIKNPCKIIAHGKWNVTIVYNKDGYLVSEKFETINAHKAPDEKSCYGEATYSFA